MVRFTGLVEALNTLPRARITHCAEFCAAFRLARPGASDAENERTYGACFSPNYHGHNYRLEVTVEGPVDPETGLVLDFLRLGGLVQEKIVDAVDHRNLNLDVGMLEGVIPTTENLAVRFWEVLAGALPPGAELAEIRLHEGRDHFVTYHGA